MLPLAAVALVLVRVDSTAPVWGTASGLYRSSQYVGANRSRSSRLCWRWPR